MNVFLRKQFLLFFLLASSVAAFGQYEEFNLQAFQNQPVRDTFVSFSAPVPFLQPTNGSISLRFLGNNKYELTYQPNAGYTGTDHFRLVVNPCSLCQYVYGYNVTISLAQIIANHDYAFGTVNTTTTVPVISNDFSSNGILQLTAIPLVNNGNATFNAGSGAIQFTPTADFEGIAYINYIVCNGYGLCDNGTVTIQILGNNAMTNDTLTIFTKKNRPQVILVPNTFQIANAPANGTYIAEGDAPRYMPNANFSGTDYLTFQNGTVNKVIRIIVIDADDNMMAFDDEAYTTPGTEIEINVLENDLYGFDSGCFSIATQPRFGSIEYDEFGGFVSYTPPANFDGVDWFTYTINSPGCTGEAETATVYVYVGNFEPAYTKFRMQTPKKTPLVIANNVPITNFRYRIADQGNLGRVIVLEGRQDTTIYNRVIRGNNMILYIPNDNINAGTDNFEIVYCVIADNGSCSYEKAVKIEVDIFDIGNEGPSCFADCVWPGDTNMDGIVNMEDLLPVGLGMGKVGVPRAEVDLVRWYGQYGEDWVENESAINFKHIDTDGNSMVTAADTVAIHNFYGYTHNLVARRPTFYRYTAALQGDVFYNPGDLVELELILGSFERPAIDLYGFTFNFPYSPLLMKPESVEIDFAPSSFLTYNSPTLHMSRNDQGIYSLESGFTRTSGLSVSGFGTVARVRFVVVEDVNGFHLGNEPIVFEIGGGTSIASNSGGQHFGMNIAPFQLQVVPKSEKEIEQTPLTEDLVKVYPNPAYDLLNVHLNGGQEFEQIQIFNLTGQLVFDTGKTQSRRTQLSVANLQNGLYILSVRTAKGVVNKKFEVIR